MWFKLCALARVQVEKSKRIYIMTLNDYLHLKNGTDVRGVACEGVEGESITLTEEAVANIAKAFCVWLISRTGN